MVLLINTDEEKIVPQLLLFLQPFHKMSQKEALIIAKFLEFYNSSIGAPEEVRWQFTFSTEKRKQLRQELGIKNTHLNQTIAKLKKKLYQNEPIIQPFYHTFRIHKGLCLALDPSKDLELKILFKHGKKEQRSIPSRDQRHDPRDVLDEHGNKAERFDNTQYSQETQSTV